MRSAERSSTSRDDTSARGTPSTRLLPPELPVGTPDGEELLSVEHLSTSFFTSGDEVPAVRDVSFSVRRGEILGLVGESGSGKSATARSVIGLVPQPGRILGGKIVFKGRDLLQASAKEWRAVRGGEMSIVLQEPMTSLNPVLRIGDQVAEMFTTHRSKAPQGISTKDAVVSVLRKVRIPRAPERVRDYPMHFSGGMRQRVSIGMAVSCTPDLLIADEPTTALDVTVQAQILDLLLELRDSLGMGMILITHDLGVVAQVCDTVAVMYAGEIVEYTDVHSLFEAPRHPYTKALLKSLPPLDQRIPVLPSIRGTPLDIRGVGDFCPFADRCEETFGPCRHQAPQLNLHPTPEQAVSHVRCWAREDVA